jgi:hypothetical protein
LAKDEQSGGEWRVVMDLAMTQNKVRQALRDSSGPVDDDEDAIDPTDLEVRDADLVGWLQRFLIHDHGPATV